MAEVTSLQVAGIVSAGGVLLGLYYYAGTRALGPDDDYWGPIRRWILPRLDAVLERYGGYATNQAPPDQLVGTVAAAPEDVEQYLYEQEYLWNFAAGLKTDPAGRTEYSSWAKRQVRQPQLRALLDRLENVRVFGRRVALLEATIARRQVHATLFDLDGSTSVYAHEEPNAVNPLMFVTHYLGGRVRDLLGNQVQSARVDVGVRTVLRDLREAGASVDPEAQAATATGEGPS